MSLPLLIFGNICIQYIDFVLPYQNSINNNNRSLRAELKIIIHDDVWGDKGRRIKRMTDDDFSFC